MKNFVLVARAFILGVLVAGAVSSVALWAQDRDKRITEAQRQKILNAFTSQMVLEATELQDQIDALSAKMKEREAEAKQLRAQLAKRK